MTNGKGGLLTLVIAAPILALFVGVGVFAFNAADTWTQANNQAVITGLSAVCGAGVVVIGLIVAIVVGIPFAIRAYGESGRAHRDWGPPPVDAPYRSLPPAQEYPALPAQSNPWTVTGGGAFDDMPAPVQDGRFRLTGGG
ncbi:MAG: hypothetical protein KJZ86_27620 [Caldilineaceae bacterium]|nr:hypothetical protein [Caldilineaceae bacterium]